MADLTPLVRDIRGIYVDRARDRLPPGSVWVLHDLIPQAPASGASIRGGWRYQSSAFPSPPDGMLYAPFIAETVLLVANGSTLHKVNPSGDDLSTPFTPLLVPGTINPTKQNPIFHKDLAIIMDATGTHVPQYVQPPNVAAGRPNYTIGNFPGTPPAPPAGEDQKHAASFPGKYGCIWKDRLVVGNSAVNPNRIGFSKPGADPADFWNITSLTDTNYAVTGLAGQRTQVLVFHASSIDRVRGTTVPDTETLPEDQEGDLIVDQLFDRAGCFDARSIAGWEDSVLFADAHGIFLTDGSSVKDITRQAGAASLWQEVFARGGVDPVFEGETGIPGGGKGGIYPSRPTTPGSTFPLSVAGVVYRDFYLCTIRHSGKNPVTFVVDLNTRRVFTISNIDATCLAYSIGVAENLYGVATASKQVTNLTSVFFPDVTILQVDADGRPVLPRISSGWNTLNDKPGYKRIVDLHFSYLADRDDDQEVLRASYANTAVAADRAIGELRPQQKLRRKKLPVRRRMEGVSVTLEQILPTKNTLVQDISVRQYPEPESRT